MTTEHSESLLRGLADVLGMGLPPRSNNGRADKGLREFTVDLREAATYEEFVQAFNRGFCAPVGGRWQGNNWDAFSDYLSYPTEDLYKLRFRGFEVCPGLNSQDRKLIRAVVSDNDHVIARFD